MNAMGMNKAGWVCPKDLNFTLAGQDSSLQNSVFRVIVTPCTNSTNVNDIVCASNEEMADFS